jgi:hypothetical protein
MHHSARLIQLVFFDAAEVKPKIGAVFVRFLGNFEVDTLKIAEEVRLAGSEHLRYMRYCVYAKAWEPETLEPINMMGRGGFMLYRAASIGDDTCPDINTWVAKAQASATCGEF